jgi:basic membrane protein A and related proteins
MIKNLIDAHQGGPLSGRNLGLILTLLLAATMVAGCVPLQQPATPIGTRQASVAREPPLFYAAYATPIEEPWDGVIHRALQRAAVEGKIRYEYTDDIGYTGDMERVLREVIEKRAPTAIIGDAYGNEEAVRRVAGEHPATPFIFGSGLGPSGPNLSVFDNWIHEPAYLCGMLAGGLTQSNTIGVVAGFPVAEVNRLVNAFIAGVAETNHGAVVQVAFINSWLDPPAARNAALAQIAAGADVLYGERAGVIQAAAEHDVFVFGNLSDQNALAPDWVVTGPVWNMAPTVEHVIDQITSGCYTALDLKDFSMMTSGGASLAPFHGNDAKVPKQTLDAMNQRLDQISEGLYHVVINESPPASYTVIR